MKFYAFDDPHLCIATRGVIKLKAETKTLKINMVIHTQTEKLSFVDSE